MLSKFANKKKQSKCARCKKLYTKNSAPQKYCKSCFSIVDREKSKRSLAKYRQTNKFKETARAYKQTRRLKLRFQILQKFNFTCQYCGRKAPDVILEIDHLYPASKGGESSESNYVVACKECNVGKGDIILTEFAA